MNKYFKQFLIVSISIVFSLSIASFLGSKIGFASHIVSNCQDHDLIGYAWSDNIGWISVSCENLGNEHTVDYGIDKDVNGDLSGYAWSDNIGWIDFNPAGSYPSDPNHGVKITGNSVKGWARALSYGGGWDGWIHFNPQQGGVTFNTNSNEFEGYAWGGDDNVYEAVVGWVSFNCNSGGVNGANICSLSDYRVSLTNSAPVVSIVCDPSSCEGYAGVPRGSDGALDIVYSATDPDNDIQSCDFQIDGATKDTNCSNTYLVTGQGIGNHTASITATDTYGASTVASIPFDIKKDINANFNCSLDGATFNACLSIKPQLNQTVYFQDTSAPSDSATINNWSWTFQNGAVSSSTEQNPNVKFVSSGNNDVTLVVTDDQGRTSSKTQKIDVESRLKPKWMEWIPR